MVRFRTEVDVVESCKKIDYKSKVYFVGSCFSNSIGERLVSGYMNAKYNLFGSLYNPVSIAQVLIRAIDQKPFGEEEMIFNQGQWHNPYVNSTFSHTDKQKVLEQSNKALEEQRSFLLDTDFLFITWGTSWVYRLKESQDIVGNCHRLPADRFERFRLSINEVRDVTEQLIERVRSLCPNIQLVFSISPIRHLKDSAHGNQLSKSVLFLGLDEVMQSIKGLSYFPAYEILMDELRDYRFYAEDLVHPSIIAVDYIFEQFSNCYFSEETQRVQARIRQLAAGLKHRPLRQDDRAHQELLCNLKAKLEAIKNDYPHLDECLKRVESAFKISQ